MRTPAPSDGALSLSVKGTSGEGGNGVGRCGGGGLSGDGGRAESGGQGGAGCGAAGRGGGGCVNGSGGSELEGGGDSHQDGRVTVGGEEMAVITKTPANTPVSACMIELIVPIVGLAKVCWRMAVQFGPAMPLATRRTMPGTVGCRLKNVMTTSSEGPTSAVVSNPPNASKIVKDGRNEILSDVAGETVRSTETVAP